MRTEPEFVRHCDDPPCDLGYVEYTCPVCGKDSNDYGNAWWGYERQAFPAHFDCERCKAKLKLDWNEEDYTYFIQESEQ